MTNRSLTTTQAFALFNETLCEIREFLKKFNLGEL